MRHVIILIASVTRASLSSFNLCAISANITLSNTDKDFLWVEINLQG